MRILRAYCVELKRSVSADEARREYLSLEDPPKKFHFFCDSEACASQSKRIRVSGVKYQQAAIYKPKYKATHFRELDKHPPDCCYHENLDSVYGDHTNRDTKRKAIEKISDFVDVFDPRPESQKPRRANSHKNTQGVDEAEVLEDDYAQINTNRKNLTRTSHLDKLVDTFLEAKSWLSKEEFFSLSVHVVGTGDVTLANYFRHISKATIEEKNKVFFGGAKLVKRYGEGFKLQFYDKMDNLPIFLYVSTDALNRYHYKKYLLELLKQASRSGVYFQVFAIGSFRLSPSGNSVEFIVDDLRHLTLLPKKTKLSGADHTGSG